jgi:hypothetical protein
MFSPDGPYAQDFPLFEETSGEVRAYQKNLSPQQKEVLSLYTYRYDKLINTSLRRNEASEYTYGLVKSIINVIKDSPLLPPLVAYRGISPWMDLEVGTKFADLGFSSKSYDIETSSGFASSRCCLLVLGYTQPSHQLFMDQFSEFPDEKELLSFPGEQFEVVEVGEVVGRYANKILAYYCRYVGNVYNDNFDIKVNPSIDKEFDEEVLPFLTNFVNFPPRNRILCIREKDKVYKFGLSDVPLNKIVEDKPSIGYIKSIFHKQLLDRIYILSIPPFGDAWRGVYTVNLNGIITRKEVGVYFGIPSVGIFYKFLLEERVIEWERDDVSFEIPQPQIIWEKK